MNTITYGISEGIYALNGQKRISYGIVIYSNADQDGTVTIVDSIRDVSSNKDDITCIVNECN